MENATAQGECIGIRSRKLVTDAGSLSWFCGSTHAPVARTFRICTCGYSGRPGRGRTMPTSEARIDAMNREITAESG